jgi:hypothetical protein
MGHGMPIGLCCVCEEPLDLSDAGICEICGNGFCWSGCGGWNQGHHACSDCHDPDSEESEG